MYNVYIINRYYPPNPAVTGEDACRLAAYILDRLPGADVIVDYIDAPYPGGGSRMKPAGRMSGLKPVYKGRNKILRFLGNFIEGYRLIDNAIGKADIVISLTDPPLMNYWTGRFCKKKGVPWVYWSFDLYPQAFASAGLVCKGNFFYTHFAEAVRENVPSLLVALGERQADFLQKGFSRRVPQVILPCGIHSERASDRAPEWRRDGSRIYFAYAGNLGEAHSLDFLVEFVNCLDPDRHRCVLALYGAQAKAAANLIRGNPAVEFVDSISRNDLFYIDVHLVSLKPDWTHVCVPSKAVTAICADGAIIFNGSPDSDAWQMFNTAGWIVDEFEDKGKRKGIIRAILAEISDPALLRGKKERIPDLKRHLHKLLDDGYADILAWIINNRQNTQ